MPKKPRGKRPRGRPRIRWLDQIKKQLKYTEKIWEDRNGGDLFAIVDPSDWKRLRDNKKTSYAKQGNVIEIYC